MVNLSDFSTNLVLESISEPGSLEDLLFMFCCLNEELEPEISEANIDPLKHIDERDHIFKMHFLKEKKSKKDPDSAKNNLIASKRLKRLRSLLASPTVQILFDIQKEALSKLV